MKYILIMLLALGACSKDDEPKYNCSKARDEMEAAASAYSAYVNAKPAGLNADQEKEWQKQNQYLRSYMIQTQTNYSRNCK